MISYFEKRSQTPVEARSYVRFYAIFSGLLFLGTVWSLWDEVVARRPWKDYQAEYNELLAAKYDSLALEAESAVDSSALVDAANAVSAAKSALETEEYVTTNEQKMDLLEDLELATREWRFSRSRSDAAYYLYKKALAEGKDASSDKADMEGHDADIVKWFDKMSRLGRVIAGLDSVLTKYTDAVQKADADQRALTMASSGYRTKSEKQLQAPISVHQVVRNDYEFTPFQEVKARVDRCQTCHTGWREELMADAQQPYRKHPVPELLAKHNPEVFGCTPCHRGQGPALTPGFAHGDGDHYWETPILKGNDVYATCNSCHFNETRLKYAKPFVKAKQLVIDSGCYGCHEIKGFSELPKIGPPLYSITAKTSPEWIFRWVRNPKEYTPHTRMPNFKFTDEQAEAVTAYLVSASKTSGFATERPRGTYAGGSVAEGKKIFETVGCQACHVAGSVTTVRDARNTSFDIAPELTRVGSKVNPDWLFDWLKNPRHYNADSRMPSLRLTDQETRNVVAFAMSMKDERTLDKASLSLDDPAKIARGDRLIREYGCAGCHLIKGMENEGKVSVELSDFGRKKYEQMDYGDTKPLPKHGGTEYQENPDGSVGVEHTWAGWVYGKLKNSRLYQTERIAQKMPVFGYTDEEIRLVRMFLISQTRDIPLPTYQRTYDKRNQDIEAGRRVTMRYNCQQCHVLEDEGGYVLAKYEEAALGPPPIPETQGAKVQEQWLHKFFKDPSTIRPWLQIRMPSFQFSEAEIGNLQKYFLGMAKQDMIIRDYATTQMDPQLSRPGRQLFETYQCAKCHPSGPVSGESAADLAPNLTLASSRLKPEWILDWLHDPQTVQPGTRMPSYFFDGKGPDESVFNGDETSQIKALQYHVWSLGRRGGTPMADR